MNKYKKMKLNKIIKDMIILSVGLGIVYMFWNIMFIYLMIVVLSMLFLFIIKLIRDGTRIYYESIL
jgi:asparagine N-glycosylation enzyme membrane subunit Stt3